MNILEKVKQNNPTVFTIIKNAILNDKVAHAYLFSAPKNSEIKYEPELLAQSLINKDPFESENIQSIHSYSDLQIIDGSSQIIKKEQVVQAAQVLQQTTLDDRGIKILIIKNIENGNKQSLNSLLKFIEEPTPKTFIIMTTNNLSQVISTIKSRAQIINLKPISQTKLIEEIETGGVEQKYSRVLSSFAKSSEEALALFNSSFKDYYEKIINTFEDAHYQKEKIITALSSIILKKDIGIVMPMIRTFLNDIWKIDQGLPISFIGQEELIKKYADSNFDFQQALVLINDFVISMQSHVNFELYKSQMLIKLRRCYG